MIFGIRTMGGFVGKVASSRLASEYWLEKTMKTSTTQSKKEKEYIPAPVERIKLPLPKHRGSGWLRSNMPPRSGH